MALRWRSLNESIPYIGQFCIVKKGIGYVASIWNDKFLFFKDSSEENIWCPIFVKGEYIDSWIPGELDFIPMFALDEDGKEIKE